MSWDNITGDEKIIPSNTSGVDEVKFESGKAKKVRLLLPGDSQPYSYLEHCLEVEKIENGQVVRTFRTIRCPKTSTNPTAPCPLCDGQQVRRRVRHACNVWDYDLNKVQKMNAGEAVFKPIATARKMGADILGMDWAIMKSGEGRNDTEYTATNLGASPFNIEITPDMLFNVEREYAPNTIEEMKQIVENAGGNWEKLIVTPKMNYPTLKEALAHVMPNGKYKGQTMEQIWESDKSSRGMINFLAIKSNRISDEKAAAQVILVKLGGVHIDGVSELEESTDTTITNINTTTPSTPSINNQNVTPTIQVPTETTPNADEKVKIIDDINKIFSSKERYVQGGFAVIIEEMKKYGNGKTNITDFTMEELKNLLIACQA